MHCPLVTPRSSDITYLPMAHGFLYLVPILDVAKPQGARLPCKAVKALDRYRTSDGASRFGTLGRSVLATTVTSGASPIA